MDLREVGIDGPVSLSWPDLGTAITLARRMKRAVKWSVRLGLALPTLLLLVPLVTLNRVDPTPFLDLPAWEDTAARLQELRAVTNVVFGETRAGFGRARLSPILGAKRDAADGLHRVPTDTCEVEAPAEEGSAHPLRQRTD
jgi:hypothetical protein